jgi:hypothetical protein
VLLFILCRNIFGKVTHIKIKEQKIILASKLKVVYEKRLSKLVFIYYFTIENIQIIRDKNKYIKICLNNKIFPCS